MFTSYTLCHSLFNIIFLDLFDSKSFLSFNVDVSAEEFAKSVTQTFGKRVCMRIFY